MGDLVTEDTLKTGVLRDMGQATSGGIGDTVWQHSTIARLSAIDRPLDPADAGPQSASHVRQWMVDGRPAGNLDDAIALLNVAIVLTEDEQRVLERVPEDWIELNTLKRAFSGPIVDQVSPLLARLHRKGLIENELRPVEQRSVSWIRRVTTVQP